MKRASALLLLLIYLGIYGGKLSLIDDTTDKPLKVFPYEAALYPHADQEALQHGIPIASDLEFVRLLEDYFS